MVASRILKGPVDFAIEVSPYFRRRLTYLL
jgi:hypothetical protein